jgi:nicotinate-nucleotide adenylyltransferase
VPLITENRRPGQANIGLMGGTFDPIHMGHLVSAEEARQQFSLDYVIFVPAGVPPHKESSGVSAAEHRYLMTTLAVMSNPAFIVSRYEVDRAEPSFTIDTVQHFARQEAHEANLYFITGADAILEILTWKDYAELLNMCTFIAVTRPGYSLERLDEMQGSLPGVMSKVHLLEIPALAISSTYIRERVALGRTIKYLTPEPVEQYIRKQRLYSGS